MQIQVQGDAPLAGALALLESQDAGTTGRARRGLETLLEGVYQSRWPEVAWCFSRLTIDGFPVEFTFTPAGLFADETLVCYTCEAAGPETPDTERLNLALEKLARLGAGQPAEEQVRRLRAMQAGRNEDFSVWASGRHDRQGDRYKVYVAVPKEGQPAPDNLARDLLGRDRLLETRKTYLRMVGCEIPTGRSELYFQVDGLETWEVGRLMGYAGLGSRLAELLDLIHEVSGSRVESALPAYRLGFSYSFAPPGGGPTIFTLYILARRMLGPDGRARERLLQAGDRLGWDLKRYAMVSEPLAGQMGPETRHAMIGFVVAPKLPLSIHIGLRPPERPGGYA